MTCIVVAACLSSGAVDCLAARHHHHAASVNEEEVDPGPQITVLGDTRHLAKVSSGGSHVPLQHALERIVPFDYSINLPNAGSWGDIPVDWRGRQSFIGALREALAAAPELTAEVDTQQHLVTVRARPNAFGAPASAAAARALAPATPVHVAPAAPAVAVAPPAPAPAPAPAPMVATHPAAASPAMHPALAPTPAAPAAVKPAAPAAVAAAPAAAASAEVATVYPVPLPAPVHTWRLELSDHTVKTALTRWAKEAGWQLVWDAPVDFGIDASATVTGSFEDALQSVVQALQKTETPIQAILYRGNKVLRIVAKGAA